jgi:uncharacterized protein (DUF2237 family)
MTQKNVKGTILQVCSLNPKTGYFRSGSCESCETDQGSHTVCAQVTKDFLEFSKSMGNDLSTPRPEFNFPGLKPGDRWCLCANRWLEAADAGMAPPVVLESTNESCLEVIDLADLEYHSLR